MPVHLGQGAVHVLILCDVLLPPLQKLVQLFQMLIRGTHRPYTWGDLLEAGKVEVWWIGEDSVCALKSTLISPSPSMLNHSGTEEAPDPGSAVVLDPEVTKLLRE